MPSPYCYDDLWDVKTIILKTSILRFLKNSQIFQSWKRMSLLLYPFNARISKLTNLWSAKDNWWKATIGSYPPQISSHSYMARRSQWLRGLRSGSVVARLLVLRVRLPPGSAYLSLVSVVWCQVEDSATSRSLVQRNPTECNVSLYVI
jgi:hypothetical protein